MADLGSRSTFRTAPLVTVITTLFLSAPPIAKAQRVITFDAPNALRTTASVVSHGGTVAGTFTDSTTGAERGYVRHPNGVFTIFDVPNAVALSVVDMNERGTIIGLVGSLTPGTERSWIREPDGTVTVFDAPNASRTLASSINSAGATTGWFEDSAQPFRVLGFVRESQGTMTVLDLAPPGSTSPLGILPSGGLVVQFWLSSPDFASTQVVTTNGKTQGISDANLVGLRTMSFSKSGLLAGWGQVPGTGEFRYFVGRPDSQLRIFDPPPGLDFVRGTTMVRNRPIVNSSGTIADFILELATNKTRGFVRDRNGRYAVFDAAPNIAETVPRDINERGDVVGSFVDTNVFPAKMRAFLRTR